MEVKVGCTGWSYEGWLGTFYPKTLQSSNWLRYYSGIFSVTEINSTYYRTPNQAVTKKWLYDTPLDFQFSAKFPSVITHDKRLRNVKSHVGEFLSALRPLENKIFGLVLQLPPTLSFEEAKPGLEELFAFLPKNYHYPIEGRHESWFYDESIEYLLENNHCLVWNEITGIENPAPITSDFIYLRLIGDRIISDSEFGKVVRNQNDLLEKWVTKINQASSKVNLAMVMVNNHLEGFAPATANLLGMKLGMKEVFWEDKKQKTLDML